jgi:hypothetical protein
MFKYMYSAKCVSPLMRVRLYFGDVCAAEYVRGISAPLHNELCYEEQICHLILLHIKRAHPKRNH